MSLKSFQYMPVYKLILIDDTLSALNMLAGLPVWNKLGFEVCGAFPSYEEAIAYIDSGAPIDVILTDIRLDVHTGLDIVEYARNRLPEVNAVLISAYSEFEYAHRAISLDVVEYLQKPITTEKVHECFSRLRERMDKRRTTQDYMKAFDDERIINEINAGLLRGETTYAVDCFSFVTNLLSKHESWKLRAFVEKLLARLIDNEFLATAPAKELQNVLSNDPDAELVQATIKMLMQSVVIKRSSSEITAVAKQYIRNNLATPMTLQSVASYLSLNASYFSTLFQKTAGESFTSFVARARLERAVQLLVDPKVKLGDVYKEVGYQSRRWFNKVFTEAFGVTPREYQLEHLSRSLSVDDDGSES